MDYRNKAFSGVVRYQRDQINDFLRRVGAESYTYPSKHFVERIVERNIDLIDVFQTLVPIIKFFRNTTYNERTLYVNHKNLKAAFVITLIDGTRKICMKTIFDHDLAVNNYDEVIKL